jgi:hypothetical protein
LRTTPPIFRTLRGCTSLSSVTISNGVKTVGPGAFEDCTSLAQITVPGSVTRMGDYAFIRCARLRGVYFQGNAPALFTALGGPPVIGPLFSDDSEAIVYRLPGATG